MVEIDSPTGDEDELAEYLVAAANSAGLRAGRDGAGNVIAATGPGDQAAAVPCPVPTIMLISHLDTVPGQLKVVERDGVLYGRGAVDAKGPLAAMVGAAVRHIGRPDIRVVVVGAVGEEGYSPGAWHLLNGERPDAVVIGEPSGVDTIVLGFKGIIQFRLRVDRPAEHTSSPAPKATEVAVDFWERLRRRLAHQFAHERPFERPIPALVTLAGDLVHASMRVSCRIPVGFDIAAFRDSLDELAGTDSVEILEQLPAVRSARNDPVALALNRAIRRHVGSPVTKVKLGTSDMNIVGPAWSVPIASYGPGDSRLSHSDEEHIDLNEYQLAIRVLDTAIGEIATGLRLRRELATEPGC